MFSLAFLSPLVSLARSFSASAAVLRVSARGPRVLVVLPSAAAAAAFGSLAGELAFSGFPVRWVSSRGCVVRVALWPPSAG